MSAISAFKAKSPKRKIGRLPFSVAGETMAIRLAPESQMNGEQLLRFRAENDEVGIEQAANGNLLVMAPVSYEGSRRNLRLLEPFADWQEKAGGGECSGSSAGFILPNGTLRSPDVAWVRREQLAPLTAGQRERFLPLCPDFVLELRSHPDRLLTLKRKMAEYLANGARLGWLIDPVEKQVFVYRPGQPVEHLKNPAALFGDPVLAGFTLDLARVW